MPIAELPELRSMSGASPTRSTAAGVADDGFCVGSRCTRRPGDRPRARIALRNRRARAGLEHVDAVVEPVAGADRRARILVTHELRRPDRGALDAPADRAA